MDKVRQYHRLFMLPAMGHCGKRGGPTSIGGGANEPPDAYRNADHHAVSAAIKWVEQGVAPEKIVASRVGTDGNVVRQRPVCAYPAEARYKGAGTSTTPQTSTASRPARRIVRWMRAT